MRITVNETGAGRRYSAVHVDVYGEARGEGDSPREACQACITQIIALIYWRKGSES